MGYFGSSSGGSSGAGPIEGPAAPEAPGSDIGSGGSGSASIAAPAAAPSDAGKFNINLTDPGGTVEGLLGGALGLASSLAAPVGAVAGAIGRLGVDGGTIGGVASNAAGALSNAAGVVGSVPLPLVPVSGVTPQGAQGAHLGDVPGEIGKVLSLPSLAVQRTVAGERALNDVSNLPADLQMKLESGQMTVSQVADQLVQRNMAFTNAPLTNLGATMVLDPMNFVGFGLGKVASVAHDAGIAVEGAKAAEDLGISQRIIGSAYNAATRGVSSFTSSTIDHGLGLTTNGVIRSLGVQTVNDLASRAGQLSPAYQAAVEDGLGVGIHNIEQAAIADYFKGQVSNGIVQRLVTHPTEYNDAIAQTAQELQTVNPDRFSRLVDNYMDKVKNQFAGMDPVAIRDQTAQLLSTSTGMTVDEANQVLPKTVSVDLAATVRASAYGNFASQLDAAKTATMQGLRDGLNTTLDQNGAVLAGREAESQAANLAASAARGGTLESGGAIKAANPSGFGDGYTLEHLTGIAPDTLTSERASGLLNQIAKKAPEDVAPGINPKTGRQLRSAVKSRPATAKTVIDDAVQRFETLRNRFSGKPYTTDEVEKYLKGVQDKLPHQLIEPTTGAHPLPPAIADLRARWAGTGYDLGFAPKDGLKMLPTGDGNYIPDVPFIPMSSDKTPLTIRSPLGRFFDGTLRGIDQTKIIAAARQRLIKYTTIDNHFLTPQESKAIFGAVMDEATGTHTAVRGLGGRAAYDHLFERVLGPTRLAQLRAAGGDPTFIVNQAFQNELKNVGATQALTGAFKTASSAAGNTISRISEQIYPAVRFSFSPMFNIQNMVETPIMAALRGVRPWAVLAKDGLPLGVDPEAARVFAKLTQDSRDVSDIMEQGVTIGFAGEKVAQEMVGNPTLMGRILARMPSIRDWKDRAQLAQIVKEHPENFRDTLAKINPKLIPILEDNYGTKDWAKISLAWAKERLALAENPDTMVSTLRRVLPKATTADELTVDNAFQMALELGARASKQTQYFQPERSWLTRTINHPYLGLYPASYMWGHVLPEFARFLVLRPFGLRAPLVGLEALSNIQRQVVSQMSDPTSDFTKFVKDHPESMYVLLQLLPGNPVELGANAPLAVRHAVEGKLTASAVAQNPINSLGLSIGGVRDIGSGFSILNELQKSTSSPGASQSLPALLDASAAQYNNLVLPELQQSIQQTSDAIEQGPHF